MEVSLGVPSLGFVGHGVEGDVIGVVDEDEVVEGVVSGESDGFLGDPFLEASVAGEGDDVVVEDGVVGGVVPSGGAFSREGVPDGVADALAEWAGCCFDAIGFGIFWVSGSDGVELTEVFEVLEGDFVSGEMEPGVDEHGAMTGGEDEAVSVEPFWCSRVEV